MALPSIKIKYLNGLLGTVSESEDGLLVLCTNGSAVSTTFVLGTPYTIYRLAGLEDLGVNATNNPALYKMVYDFYQEADEGTTVIVVAYANTETMTELCDKDSGPLKALLIGLKGKARGLVIGSDPASGYTPVTTEGLDSDVFAALPKAQALADLLTEQIYAPFFVLFEGRSFQGASTLRDLTESTYNRCMVFIGDDTTGSSRAAVGTLAGRIASIPVQRSPARVKDGKLSLTAAYLGSKTIDDAVDDITTVHDKGYVTFRTFVGKSGYYISDDNMACEITDDYASLPNRRVIDKAYRIAYMAFVELLKDEVEINSDGTVDPAVIKSWEASVENALKTNMTAYGNLSANTDNSDTGCSVFIDTTQNLLTTKEVDATVKVNPFGYPKTIAVNLGFNVTT